MACVDPLPFGSYTVRETQAPPGMIHETTARPVTVDALGACPSTGTVVVVPVFTDTPAIGALRIRKESSGANAVGLGGAVFEIVGPTEGGSTTRTATIETDGTACVGGLPFGSYTVRETQAPPGFVIDTSAGRPVMIGALGSCPSTGGGSGGADVHGFAGAWGTADHEADEWHAVGAARWGVV